VATSYLDGFYPSGQPLSAPASASKSGDESAPPSRPVRRGRKLTSEQRLDLQAEKIRSETEADPRVSARAGLLKPGTAPSDSAEADREAPLNNMGVHTRQLPVDTSSLRVVVGLDKITVFVWGEWTLPDPDCRICPDGARAVREDLLAALIVNRDRPFLRGVRVFGGTCFPADGHYIYGKKVPCPVQVHCNGMRIALGDIDRANPNLPLAQVIIDSAALSERGHLNCLENLGVVLSALGIRVRELTVLRVDVCADVVGLPASEFLHFVHTGGAVVSKFQWNNRSTWGPSEALETVAVGKSSEIRLQLYDKLKRVRAQLDEGKSREVDVLWAGLVERWGCVPADVLRCEFQISGGWFRERFGSLPAPGRKPQPLRTIGDVIAHLDKVAYVLFTEQFRVHESAIDRRNRNYDRVSLHPVWAAIVDAVAVTQFGDRDLSTVGERVVREVRRKSVERVQQDFRAVLVRAAAMHYTAEELDQLRSDEEWVAIAMRVAASACHDGGFKLADCAIATRNFWEAKDLMPESTVRWCAGESPRNVLARVRRFCAPGSVLGDEIPVASESIDDLPF
jgi:hypothetical protein